MCLESEKATASLSTRGPFFFIENTPVRSYGLTPLHFAPRPDAALRKASRTWTIEAHLEDLLGRQEERRRLAHSPIRA